MSASRYLIRFDDICPKMNWPVWERVEALLRQHAVRPIVAVVPDNRDSKLDVATANPHFWDRVRQWDADGWTIGLHGFEHLYHTREAGVIGINARSEFAGLPYDEQHRKIGAGLALLASQGIRPTVWVAPGHSFDRVTLKALAAHGLRTVSDGFYWRTVRDREGTVWIPQQLWRQRNMPFGTWTICYHINSWGEKQLLGFSRTLEQLEPQIVSARDLINEQHATLGITDRLFAAAYRRAVIGRKSIR